jgi:hypothetical protein
MDVLRQRQEKRNILHLERRELEKESVVLYKKFSNVDNQLFNLYILEFIIGACVLVLLVYLCMHFYFHIHFRIPHNERCNYSDIIYPAQVARKKFGSPFYFMDHDVVRSEEEL